MRPISRSFASERDATLTSNTPFPFPEHFSLLPVLYTVNAPIPLHLHHGCHLPNLVSIRSNTSRPISRTAELIAPFSHFGCDP